MLLDQAIAEVQQIAGWRTDKATQIQAALQYAQTEREKPGLSFPWWLKKRSSLVLTPNQQVYAYPSDYIQESEESQGNLYVYTIPGKTNSRTVFLRKRSFEEAQVRYFGVWPFVYSTPSGAAIDQTDTIGPGMPIDYVEDASGLYLYPVPNAGYTLVWSYWGNDTAQALGQTNGWLTNAPWVLIGDAAKKICADLQNQAGLATAQEILARAESNLFRSVVAREESGRRRYMGSKL